MNEMKGEEGKNMRSKGITLIALVITIIVLLILAGVSIATLTGNNGILTRANEAKTETEDAEENELRKLTQAEAATYLEDYEYTDVTGEKITIPAKCAVSKVKGENTLEDGLVIIDANGNEWVWIEISKNEVFLTANNSKEYENIKNDLIAYAFDYREGIEGEGRYWNDKYYDNCGIQDKDTYDNMYNDMLSSIYTNEGFWVGRYEAGFSKDRPRTENNDIIETAKIQRNLYPYNFVTCSQAQTLASNISPDKSKTSSLLFGIQWDLVCKFLEEKSNLSIDEIKTNSTGWGNYSNAEFQINNVKYAIYNQTTNTLENWNVLQGSYLKMSSGTENIVLLSTGASNYTKKMNIYDLAGNLWEWTLEHAPDSDRPSTRRGSGYKNPGYTHPASNKGAGTTLESMDSIGFRVALY